MTRRFSCRWLPLRDATAFIARHHRHHDPAQGAIVALGLWEGERLVGAGVLGRPVSRELQRRGMAEVTRLAVLPELEGVGEHAACAASVLYSRLRRASDALGFARTLTYTLPEESGASLRGDGWQRDLELVGGGEWAKPSRPRASATHPTQRKVRWWAPLKAQKEIAL